MLPTFQTWTFLRVCTEKMIDHQYRENDGRSINPNCSQIKAYCAVQVNEKKLYLIDNFIEQLAKL